MRALSAAIGCLLASATIIQKKGWVVLDLTLCFKYFRIRILSLVSGLRRHFSAGVRSQTATPSPPMASLRAKRNLHCTGPALQVQIRLVSLSAAQNQNCHARDSITAIALFVMRNKRKLKWEAAITCVLILLHPLPPPMFHSRELSSVGPC